MQIKENIKASPQLATAEFPVQRASNTENIPIWWRHHVPEAYPWLPIKLSWLNIIYNLNVLGLYGQIKHLIFEISFQLQAQYPQNIAMVFFSFNLWFFCVVNFVSY